jgi:hypothetical protein
MSQLWRICYVRDGAPRNVTCFAADAIAAAEFSELWERMLGCPVLTVKPLGASKIAPAAYTRRRALLGVNSVTRSEAADALTAEEQFQLELKERGV